MDAIYLASGGPCRREVLENLDSTVRHLPVDIDETSKEGEAAVECMRRMTCEKSQAAVAQWFVAHDEGPEFAVLTADTTATDGAAILGRPESEADVVSMLERLSGRTHQVLTAACVYWQGVCHDVVQMSEVRFKTLTVEGVTAYVASDGSMGEAGAYGVQGLDGVFVEHLQGSFAGVMRLPVYETVQLLKSLDLEAPPLT